jgi:hypothetical protein
MKMGREATKDKEIIMPNWIRVKTTTKEALLRDFLTGAIAFLELLIIVVFPIMLCAVIFGLIGKKEFGGYIGLLIGAPAFAYATVVGDWITASNLCSIFKKFIKVYRLVITNYKKLLIPSVLFLCFQMMTYLVIPLAFMGASIFFGFLFLIAYVKRIE